jgi:hypothetical protein
MRGSGVSMYCFARDRNVWKNSCANRFKTIKSYSGRESSAHYPSALCWWQNWVAANAILENVSNKKSADIKENVLSHFWYICRKLKLKLTRNKLFSYTPPLSLLRLLPKSSHLMQMSLTWSGASSAPQSTMFRWIVKLLHMTDHSSPSSWAERSATC